MKMNMDVSELMRQCRAYEKQAQVTERGMRIAVLGSYSIQYYVKALRYWLHAQGVEAEFYEGEYDGIAMDVLDDRSKLYEFRPEVVILLPYFKDIRPLPALFEDAQEMSAMADKQLGYYHQIWSRLHEKTGCQILQSNIVVPPFAQLGNLEGKYAFSKSCYYHEINKGLFRIAEDYVTIIDFERLAEKVGKRNWFDWTAYYLTKTGFNLEYLPQAVELTASVLLAYKGKTRKCLALDLDNTLWGGVVGDEGYDGIQIDPNHAVGEAYLAFQEYVLSLKERGVILAVCSKNDEAIAKEPFEKNPHMRLKLADIACFVANWEDKASNLKRIATELNIGVDSLVFFDDNPAEREIVKKYVPEVEVIEVPEDPALYVTALDEAAPFEWVQLTKEDVARPASYVENRKREALKTSFVDYEEYLRALAMRGTAGEPEITDVGRFSQLINKSNQFNLRTQRYTEGQIHAFLDDADYYCLCVRLRDMFSDYGIISCVILKFSGKECFIDTWVMSCRVLKRGVENLMFKKILELAKTRGCSCVRAEYIRTKKNAMVENFYDDLGFTAVAQEEGRTEYLLKDFQFAGKIFIEEDE